MLTNNYSSMYILYLQPLITDILFQLIHMCYIAPAVLIHSNKPFGPFISYVLDSGQSYCFFNNSLSQVSLAANRLVVTVLLRLNFFTFNRTVLLSIAQHLLALSITTTAQYILPCCRQVLEYSIFNFRTVLILGLPNDSLTYIRLPIKIACSAIPFVIYCIILLSTRSIGRQLKLKSVVQTKRRKQELKFAGQFATIALIYTLSWLLFTLLPTSAVSINWVNGLPALVSLLNASTNAIVFIFNDRKKIFVRCFTSSSPTGSSIQNQATTISPPSPSKPR
ncbi:hypothetical protein PMAYCL1PPCAC_30314 [Pristionchus mayeri]|uniref:G protein-coupled receptor n=1 Tax=Pristionchus mayeri TaxID=1317129 RepID=A0AAN5ID18_9BILA|nr:hypothetical protein PMAYCL1PPCAC_30314 [Pristionchus mayeri]